MDSREYGDFSQKEEDVVNSENEDEDNHYSNRVHSLHRNKAFKSHNDLILGHEARVGGLGVRTLRRLRDAEQFQDVLEHHANLIVAKMEKDPALIEDSPASDDLRREALRDMPQCLTLKRCVKQKLQKSVDKKAKRKRIGCWKMMCYQISFSCLKLKYGMKDVIYFFELWYSSLKRIEGSFGSAVGSFFKFLRTIFLLNFFMAIVSVVFIIVPQILHLNQRNETTQAATFDFQDIFTGTGFFTTTPLYYGFYTNDTLYFLFATYSMPHAYFFTMVAIYLVFLIFFGFSAAAAYKKSFIETEGDLKNVFAQKIFCGWDYSIATNEAAALKSQAIYLELKELLFESMLMKTDKSCLQTFCIRLKQLSINILVLCGLFGVGNAMWFFLDRAYEESFSPLLTALFVNVMLAVIPIVLSWIVQFESYSSPRTSLYLTLFRTFILGFIIIAVLFTFWLQNPDQECWGTNLGQEIFRLILYDFIISVIFSSIIEFITYIFCRCLDNTRSLTFDISRNTIHIIYNQILLWVGLIFSPLLPIIMTIKLLIIWYTRKFILLKCCKPSTKTWRATQTITWFLMTTFVGLLLVIGLLGYILSMIRTTNCGPFSHYDYIYEIVTIDMFNLKNNSKIFNFVLLATKPGCIALVLIGLFALIYYLRAKACSQRKLVAVYRKMLVWEARDKEFLIKNIANITKGKWEYKLKDGRKSDPMLSSSFIMRFQTDNSNTPRGSLNNEIFVTPSSSAVNRHSTDLGDDINNDLYENFKKIS